MLPGGRRPHQHRSKGSCKLYIFIHKCKKVFAGSLEAVRRVAGRRNLGTFVAADVTFCGTMFIKRMKEIFDKNWSGSSFFSDLHRDEFPPSGSSTCPLSGTMDPTARVQTPSLL